jgi:hypothetical protein
MHNKMKLGAVLTATDDNPLYVDFIPSFIKAWKTLFPNVKIVIVLVANSIPENLVPYAEHIKLFSPIPGVKTAFVAQCVRLLAPRDIDTEDGVLITDMDMYPMNRSYYIDAISNISDDTFVTYRDVCLPYEIAMCYNIATPRVWSNLFGTDSSENTLKAWYSAVDYDGKHGGVGWSTDQRILLRKFNSYSGPKITLNDSITKFNRLDRIHSFRFDNLEILKQEVVAGRYIDYHGLRPYSEYKSINDMIVSWLSEQK